MNCRLQVQSVKPVENPITVFRVMEPGNGDQMEPVPVLTFRAVQPAEAGRLAAMAARIWQEAYGEILSVAQIGYMLQRMYDPGVIVEEIRGGTVWEWAVLGGEEVGFLSWSGMQHEPVLHLHKLYLDGRCRGRGLGQQMLGHVKTAALALGMEGVELRVNRENRLALRAYERAGFRRVKEDCADIGGGFVMDDHILRWRSDPCRREEPEGIRDPSGG
jgi:ribosomal protein S18 acetylase RimI-like enzyme